MAKKKIRVGIIFGGKSGEHEVSLASAESVMRAIDKEKYEPVPIGITKEGRWLTRGDPMKQLKATANELPALEARVRLEETVDEPAAEPGSRDLVPGTRTTGIPDIDVIFPLLHGPLGEDGTVQGLLELADIPYVGSGVLASALGMDKAVMKNVFRQHGLPVVKGLTFKRRDWEHDPEAILAQVEATLPYPCFAKPANLGSSVGVSKARTREELRAAINTAIEYDRKFLVEEAIEGREIECSVLGNDDPIASIPGEVIPAREFYDYAAKYTDERTQLIVPADISAETAREVQRLAIAAFLAIDAAGMARVDFFLTRDGRVIINEINTIPGFTAVSMYPKMWEASGISYPELIDRLIQLALERHADKSRSKTSYQATGDE